MDRKRRIFIAAILYAVACCLVCFTGCGDEAGIADITDLTKITPVGTGTIMHIDVEKIRQDDDLDDLFNTISNDSSLLTRLTFDLDLSPDNIRHFGVITEVNLNIMVVITGDLNLDDIRAELDELGYDKQDDYMDAEIWLADYNALAIRDNIMVIGPEHGVKASIETMSEKDTSVYEEREVVRGVVDKLTTGIITAVTDGSYYEGGLAMGFSLIKVDADTMEMNGLVRFIGNAAAQNAMGDLKAELEDGGQFFQINLSCDNEYLKFSARMGSEYAETLF